MRVLNVEKIDNGFIVQRPVTEQEEQTAVEQGQRPPEGISIAVDAMDALNQVAAILGITMNVSVQAPAKPEGSGPIQFPTGGQAGSPPPATPPPAEAPPAAPGSYEEEIDRIVAANDRDAAHARLKVHVEAGVIQDYNKRLGVEKLAAMLVEADKLANGGTPAPATPPPAAPPEVPAAMGPNCAGSLNGQPLPDGVPAPTPGTPGFVPNPAYAPAPATPPPATGGAPVLKDLTDALQRLAATDPATGPTKAFGIMQQYGAAKASDIPADKWAEAIASANLQAGA
jgi:hypothetical protein